MSDEDAKRLWISNVLGFQFPGSDDEDAPATKENLTDRLHAIRELVAQTGGLDQIVAQLREVAESVRDNGGEAIDDVEMLERLMAEIIQDHTERELAGETDQMVQDVDRDDSRISRMRSAVAAARADIRLAAATLSQACVATAQALKLAKEQQGILSGDEDEIIAEAEAAGDEVPPFDETASLLGDLIDEYEAAADAATQRDLLAEADEAIAAYRDTLTDPLLTEMQETDAGSYKIKDAIDEALAALEHAMQP